MQVLKFGGSSVATSENINKVIAIVKAAMNRDKTICVLSAIGGCTDMLIRIGKLAESGDRDYEPLVDALEQRHYALIDDLIAPDFHENITEKITGLFDELRGVLNGVFLIREISHATMDLIMSFGELFSTFILAEKFSSTGISCKWIDARELIKTEYSRKQNVVIKEETFRQIKLLLAGNNCKLYIVPGFIASDKTNRTTTLGRGGSDYTASLIAVATEARRLEIWTDVDGMMTADPRIVPDARTIAHISYKEASELSHFGAKVIYPPTIQPVIDSGIPILVKNTFAPEHAGTLIERNPPEGTGKIKGLSGNSHIALLSMEGSGMVGVPGYSSRLFDVLAKNQINIILITQASSVNTMLVAIEEADAEKAKQAGDELFAYEISLKKIEPLKVEKGFSIISLVGDDMKNQSGAGGRMFEAIGSKGISIRAIAQGSSEKNISAVVLTEDFDETIQAIHNEFFGASKKQINLFIAGYGNVGKSLVEMIEQRRNSLSENIGIEINIIGICNSTKMLFDTKGLHLDSISRTLTKGGKPTYKTMDFIDEIERLARPNSLFVDCTSDLQISTLYQQILSEKIGIVTCNKIANSLDIQYYKGVHATAKKEGVPFRYEANVGAALPIISTIRQMLNSGDTIHKIEATLSGSLNYLFNNYNGTTPFASVLHDDQHLGYTEPDPRTDLKGLDLMRKALILGREIGMEINITDIEIHPFLPEECLTGSVEVFYAAVEKHETFFKSLYDKAAGENKKLSFCIEIENGHIKAGVQRFDSEHPFYASKGSDNVIILYSEFYPNGLRIQGAGAGTKQTASGLLNDILL
ncbi:MAG: bifunctional aspartate kinase/homoserine dehydrogenase I [Prevotellaceae bacterium]|jgi:aspartokinase/homoserine dehydrogenase 1|nr:bifunctional aspartate kinase/homoserine dehydrogenase I [Prevotellaceae bacterium]